MNMQFIIAILVIIVLAVLGFILYQLISQINTLKEELGNKGTDPILMEWLKEMKSSVEKNSDVLNKQLNDQRSTIDQQMKNQNDLLNQQLKNQSQVMFNQTKLISERLENAQDVMNKLHSQLGGINEFGKDMKDLSNVLKSPKLRGGLGEQFLYEILANFLPNSLYKTQYKFKDGSICDAVILTDKGIIPIDSKFPLENFKLMQTLESGDARDKAKKVFESDVKKRIDEISKKYILPGEGTTEQAVMYVPSENVFYELIVNSPQIEEYSRQKNVLMASPNTLSYFLKVVLVAYQQNELGKHAGEILNALKGLKVEADKFYVDFSRMEGHISDAYKSVGQVKVKYEKFLSKIDSIHALEGGADEVGQKALLE